jgi:membrane associated rhomboid family serine protease
VKEPTENERIPWANALLIVISVLVFFVNGFLGWKLGVGQGAGFLTILTYGFSHADPMHLITNMWVLWLFGNPVNRRIGNVYYLLAYVGTIVAIGIVAWLFAGGLLIGSSGAIFAVMLLFMMLMPRAGVIIGYVALFPFTLLAGLISRPKHWVFWFLRWDVFEVRAWIGLILVPLLEIWSLWSWGWNWTNLGHLFGLMAGVVIVLLLPTQITMRRRLAASGVS